MKALVLSSAALLALAYAVVPVAAALPVSFSCGADLDYWSVAYHCHATNVGGAGTLVWCPDPVICAQGDVLDCHVDLTPPWFCQVG